MLECNLTERDRLVAGYVTEELSEKEMRDFEAHYFECSVCAEAVRLAAAAVHIIKEDGPRALADPNVSAARTGTKLAAVFGRSPRPASGNRRYVFPAIAAAAFAVLILMIIFPRNDRQLHEEKAVLAANFTPSPYFENLARQAVRGGQPFKQFSPVNGANLNAEIQLGWKPGEPSAQTARYEVVIYNNKRDEILRTSVTGMHVTIGRKLPQPGIYYWVLLTEDELLHVGWFYYRKP